MNNPPDLLIQEGAPVTTVDHGQQVRGDWGRKREKQPVGGDDCYKVRLASEPSRPHTFYATVKKYRDDKPPLGISGKDVSRYVRGTPTGSRLERRTHYHWDWIDKTVDDFASPKGGGAGDEVRVQYFANNYSQTHQFTADNWNQWVTISVRCCRLRTGVEGVPVTGFIGAFGVAENERFTTIYHYMYDDQDQEGSSGPDARVLIVRPLNSPAQEPSRSEPTDLVHSCVSDAALADVQGYAGETWRESSDHVERWSRVLAAFGENNSYSNNPMTATEAHTYADRGLPRWVPVVTALQCLETAPEQQPEEQPSQAEAEAEAEAPTPAPPPATSCVSGTMLDTVRGYYDANKDRAPGYGLNWKRVLIAFGDVTDANQTAFTAAEAKDRESRWFGWKPVRQTLECIEAAN